MCSPSAVLDGLYSISNDDLCQPCRVVNLFSVGLVDLFSFFVTVCIVVDS